MNISKSAKKNQPPGTITIRSTKLPHATDEYPPSFEVHVQVELDGRKVAWNMLMLPGTRVPIQIDETQRVILIVHEQDLLIDSSQIDRAYSLLIEESGSE